MQGYARKCFEEALAESQRVSKGDRPSQSRPLTQKDRVLYSLRDAGSAGLRSDFFLKISIPRAAARIRELREEGHDIRSERERQFVRYTLVSVGAAPGSSSSAPVGGGVEPLDASVDPDEQPLSLLPEDAGRARPLNPLSDREAA